ncbi:MAG: 3-phosphoshikimate 1-carboxyvinyltransferase [Desulfovibrionaceae bacterium]|nr:3-phosphoshikimate 1-carboxyvinyltransferase [Desulfovibrionaceae bacterium]
MIEVTAPSSKSFSHRYLIAAALANGVSEIRNVLDADDTACTREILSLAGAVFTPLENCPGGWRVQGTGGRLRGGKTDPLPCYVHESGTTCRLLSAVLASGRGAFRIHGAPRMHDRPIGVLVEALRAFGCDVTYEEKDGYPPFVLRTRGLDAEMLPAEEHLGRHTLAVSMAESSQYFSGLLLACPQTDEIVTLTLGGSKVVSWPYIGLTLQCMADFNIKFLVETRESTDEDADWELVDWRKLHSVKPGCLRIKVQPGYYRAGRFQVEGDWSGASYLVAAGALGRERTTVLGMREDSLQGDRALLDILEQMGASLLCTKRDISVVPRPLHGVTVDMSQCPDLVPTVAVLAAFADGDTTITNVAHLRIKESDRIKAPATSLRSIGVHVEEHDDGLTIHGLGSDVRVNLAGVRLFANNDHRMAMSQALYSLRSNDVRPAEIFRQIDNPQVVSKSFPNFWKTFEAFAND